MSGLPKQLESANPLSPIKMTTMLGLSLFGTAAETNLPPDVITTRNKVIQMVFLIINTPYLFVDISRSNYTLPR